VRVSVSEYNLPNRRLDASPARRTSLPRNQKAAISEHGTLSLVAQSERKGMGSSVNKPTRVEEVSPRALLATCLNSLVECCGFLMYLYPFSPCNYTLPTTPSLPPLNGFTCNICVRVKHDIHTSVKHQAIVSPCFATMSEDNHDEPSRIRTHMTKDVRLVHLLSSC